MLLQPGIAIVAGPEESAEPGAGHAGLPDGPAGQVGDMLRRNRVAGPPLLDGDLGQADGPGNFQFYSSGGGFRVSLGETVESLGQ